MSDAVALALITAIPSTVAALGAAGVAVGGLCVSLRNGRKADVITAEAAEIHKQTNSHLTALTTDLKEARSEIGNLKGP